MGCASMSKRYPHPTCCVCFGVAESKVYTYREYKFCSQRCAQAYINVEGGVLSTTAEIKCVGVGLWGRVAISSGTASSDELSELERRQVDLYIEALQAWDDCSF